MRKFWGFYDNGTYRVGCNGATVYVFDSQDNELARFKDFPYAYTAAFIPNTNIIAVKSIAGYIGFYDLDKLKLIKKHLITKKYAQDMGFAFSPDGQFFYNIEERDIETQLCIYETKTFSKVKTLLSNRKDLLLKHIEFDKSSDKCYILGAMLQEHHYQYGFIGLLNVDEDDVIDIKRLENEQYNYAYEYKKWEIKGFTEKSLEWNDLKHLDRIVPVSLKDIYNSI